MLTLLNGISLGLILFLIASGLSLVMGAMGVINLSHGALYMVGAYVGWAAATSAHLDFGLAVLAGAAAAGLVGLVTHQGFFRHLQRYVDEQILVSFGFIYILTDAVQWIWGPTSKAPFAVSSLAGSVSFGGFSYPTVRVFIIVLGLVFAVGLWLLQQRTRLGAVVRAGMDDAPMVRAMGINLELVAAGLFVLGSAVAGAAGVIGGLIMGAQPSFGIDIMLLALVVVVLGGVGSIPGALVAALLVGITSTVSVVAFPAFSSASLYVVMAIVLLFRPAGISGRAVST
jgi:branched-chain amino acid transport system permease protein